MFLNPGQSLVCSARISPLPAPKVGSILCVRGIAVLLLIFAPQSVHAQSGAGDVTLRTNHPQYAGEGAFQTIEDCVEYATRGKTDPQEKAIAMYLWLLTHQWHLMSPMEWCVPGRIPDSADPGDYETVLFDANRGRFSYGYGLCGTVHAWNEPYWKALGLPARRREFPNHVNSEIFYDDAWHAFDTDMAGLLFRPDGVVAGYDDIQKNPKLAESVQAPLPHYPFSWPEDFNTMKAGWKEVAERAAWYRLYNGGYAAHPGIVSLRPGESFTRWYDRDHYGDESKRRFWQNQNGGPSRQWAYFDNGTPTHDKAKSNSRSDASYCNGEFVYSPPLSLAASCEDAVATSNIGHRATSPHLHSIDREPATVTFRHFSPYVICGDPADDANPMSATATNGLIVEGITVADVTCEVSANEGQTWSAVHLNSSAIDRANGGQFTVDLTEHVKGRYGWHVRFSLRGDAGLDHLQFTTTTQVCQAMYPRLTANGTEVTYRSKPRAVVALQPNFALAESEVHVFEETSLRSENLRYSPRSSRSRYAYLGSDQNPAHVVFRINAPRKLHEVCAAVRYQIPVPPTPGCDFQLQVSTDHGKKWTPFAVADISQDNEYSSGWLSGKADISAADSLTALVRFQMSTPGRNAALIDARLYGIHDAPHAGPVDVEFGWMESGQLRTHNSRLAARVVETKLNIPTGARIKDSFVRITARPE
jgi:hypothetical protein